MSDPKQSASHSEKPSSMGTFNSLWRPLKTLSKASLLLLLAIGTLAGIIFWGGVNTVMEYTNRIEFCTSCHEMTIPYEELKRSTHYVNRVGPRVTCADCHVASGKTPTDYTRKFLAKVLATGEVYGHLTGKLDTPEKFEANRLEMAKIVWAQMKATDSKECRNCHDLARMDPEKIKKRAQQQHESAKEDGKTCIDCHKGLVHKPVNEDVDGS